MATERQLELFVEAAADLNFRRTADRVGISQPALSKQIAALEASLGVSLFERSHGRSPTLSSAGRSALHKAVNALQLHRELKGPTGRPPVQNVRVFVRSLLSERYVRPAIDRLSDRLGNIRLEFSVCDDISLMLSQIKAGQSDIAVFRGTFPMAPGVTVMSVARLPCSLYAAPDLGARIARGELTVAEAPMLIPPSHSELHEWVLGEIRAAGIAPANLRTGSQFMERLERQMLDGEGVALLYDGDMRQAVAKGSAVRIVPTVTHGNFIMAARLGLDHAVIDRVSAALLDLVTR